MPTLHLYQLKLILMCFVRSFSYILKAIFIFTVSFLNDSALNNRNEVHNECNELESFPNHLFLPLVCGNIVLLKNGPWCQKGWRPLPWSTYSSNLNRVLPNCFYLPQILTYHFLLVLNILLSTSEENSEINTVNACFGLKRNCVSLFFLLCSSHFFTLQVQPENTGQLL